MACGSPHLSADRSSRPAECCRVTWVSVPQAPRLTAEQRAAALRRATAVRAERGRLRTELKAGRLSLADLLDRAAEDESVAGMRVSALLEALPGYGRVRAGALLTGLGIATSRRVRGLGPRQRAALLDRIDQAAQSQT